MRNILVAVLLAGSAQGVLAGPASPAEIRQAWLAFSNAHGEASLIRGDLEHATANEVFRIIPEVASDLNEDKRQLGFELFREARLSRDGSVACVTCHVDLMGGVDRQPLPFGIGGAQGNFNAPTVFNAALNFRQFWDGRALTLQEQALGPIQNPIEFGHDLDGVVAVLNSIPDYRDTFERLYPDGVSAANLADVIAYYEIMTFTGLSSPFLRQFDEPPEPLNSQALRGQQRFVEVGCASCHNGINLGGNSYQKLGVALPWYGTERLAREADLGLATRTGRDADRYVYKVPTLHNVAATGPWFHDGSVTSLQQAVDRMARHQSGRYLDNEDIDDIAAFLRSLGDSLGLLGDCSVSGNYGVTMDCSISKPASASGPDLQVTAKPEIPWSDTDALVERHLADYHEAQQRVAAAPDRIAAEVQRIAGDQVAHYDFLQFEHIEMLRHARALSYPPAGLEPARLRSLLVEAQAWQDTAEQYELTIADFLRNHAVVDSARANFDDLLRILALDADEKAQPLLTRAGQAAKDFYAGPGPAAQQELEQSVQELLSAGLNAQRVEELQLQVRLLAEGVAGASSLPQFTVP